MATPIKLVDEQVDEISVIDHNKPYKRGDRAKEGKTFSRFRYDGIVFTVDSENPFIEAYSNGTIASVKLIPTKVERKLTDADGNETTETVDGLTFDSFVTMAQQLNRAKHNYSINRFKSLETAPVTDELINQLMGQ